MAIPHSSFWTILNRLWQKHQHFVWAPWFFRQINGKSELLVFTWKFHSRSSWVVNVSYFENVTSGLSNGRLPTFKTAGRFIVKSKMTLQLSWSLPCTTGRYYKRCEERTKGLSGSEGEVGLWRGKDGRVWFNCLTCKCFTRESIVCLHEVDCLLGYNYLAFDVVATVISPLGSSSLLFFVDHLSSSKIPINLWALLDC
jgi:hypothetical protein